MNQDESERWTQGESSTSTVAPALEGRMVFVDALRGIAAVSVLLHHLIFNNAYQSILRGTLPFLFVDLCFYGKFGVEVFFVISGFVITHSLIHNPLTPRSLGNFILRRQVRLDPPYWTVLVFVLAWGCVAVPQFGSPPTANLSAWEILANFLYLQRIAGVPVLLVVAWTLCLEIQFYLLQIVHLSLGRLLCRGRRSTNVEAILLLITGSGSLAYRAAYPLPTAELYTWFPHGWCYFVGGALSYLSIRDSNLNGVFRAYLMVYIAFNTVGGEGWRPDTTIGLLAFVILWWVGKAGKLTTWLNQRVFQYLGRISYSLYLVHFPITVTMLTGAYYRFLGWNPWMSVVCFLAAMAVSFVAAHLLHVLVERPSMRLATTLKRQADEIVPTNAPQAVATTP